MEVGDFPSKYAFMLQVAPRIIGVLMLLFFAILFLQSGLDKITDHKGNRGWLVGQFSKSIFNGIVPLLLIVLTAMEMMAGLGALAAVILWGLVGMSSMLPFAAVAFCALTLLVLFMGQRIAKDYTGAAGIVPYFIVAILALIYFASQVSML
jgi:phosphoglycerol transferase MdoB-like AlkP superfamily enzyme